MYLCVYLFSVVCVCVRLVLFRFALRQSTKEHVAQKLNIK